MDDPNRIPDPRMNARRPPLAGQNNPLRIAGGALLGWWRAASLDALIVGFLWLIGLELIRVPLAPLWAFLGALLQFIPTFGGMIRAHRPGALGRIQRPR